MSDYNEAQLLGLTVYIILCSLALAKNPPLPHDSRRVVAINP